MVTARFSVGDRVLVNSALRPGAVTEVRPLPEEGAYFNGTYYTGDTYTVQFPDGHTVLRHESELTV